MVIGIAVALYFLPYVNNEFVFFSVVIISSLLPNIDSGFSFLGKKKIFKPVRLMTNHKRIMHTYTFTIIVSGIFAFFYPIIALPFFLGFSFHLLADSFPFNVIMPFWPLKAKSKGVVKSGGPIDKALFMVFIIIDVVLLVAFIILDRNIFIL